MTLPSLLTMEVSRSTRDESRSTRDESRSARDESRVLVIYTGECSIS